MRHQWVKSRSPLPPDADGAVRLPLSRGYFAMIDAEDADRVSPWLWSVLERPGRSSYVLRREKGLGTVYLHRFLMNAPPGLQVDHVDGDGLNCRRGNMRLCTASQNQMNRANARSEKSSRYKGVFWSKHHRKWIAQIKLDYVGRCIGRFDSEDDAAMAYDAAARETFGAFARLNFPSMGCASAS